MASSALVCRTGERSIAGNVYLTYTCQLRVELSVYCGIIDRRSLESLCFALQHIRNVIRPVDGVATVRLALFRTFNDLSARSPLINIRFAVC